MFQTIYESNYVSFIPWDHGKIGIKLGTKHVLYRIRVSILTGLKVYSLTCKYVFYRPGINTKGYPMELYFEGLEMKQTNK